MLDQAFDALNSYDWGTDRKVLDPIDKAVVATHGDAAAREKLEKRLVAVLQSQVSRDAKDFVCRKLRVIGTAASVPELAKLLSEKEHSHMARYALESIPAPDAADAMRNALPKLVGELKVGVIGSLGARKDAASVSDLAALLSDQDSSVARAAAFALGAIRSKEAAQALSTAKPNNDARLAATDATLACAEELLKAGKNSEARKIYSGLATSTQPKHIRLAATRGMLACAAKKG